MTVMLVNYSFYTFDDTEVLMYKTESGVEMPVTITGGFMGSLFDLLDEIELQHGITFSGLADKEFVEVSLSGTVTAIDFKDLELGKWIGISGTNLKGDTWGLHRFMVDDIFLGHEAYNYRPYEIESEFTLDGKVYKDTPKISTIFYNATFGDYSKRQVEMGVIPFVENYESDTDMYIGSPECFQDFFNSDLVQLNFDKAYLQDGEMLNSSSVKMSISERPSTTSSKRGLFLTESDDTYIILTDGSFIVVER